jgi:glycosyltransferase involved in cell wall biosynthesis
MRIALVVAGPFPAMRGSQVLVQHLATGLRSRGHVVDVVAHRQGRRVRPGPGVGRIGLDLLLAMRLWHHVRRCAPDVIHAHNYEAAIAGLLVGRLTGRPLVYHGHCALAEELPTYTRGRWARRVMRWVGGLLDAHVPRRADFCIAVTDALGTILERAGVAASALACIPPASAPFDLGPPPPVVLNEPHAHICYAGNVDGYQNLDFLLRVFARVRVVLPWARLALVTHEGCARGFPRRAGIEVVRADSYATVRRLLEAAHVAVCPRVERSGFPMKLLGYMAAGKAIVASAASAKGLVDGVTARVVADGDVAGFADAIVELLQDEGARARLGAAARRVVEETGAWDRALDRIEAVYRRVHALSGPALVPVAVVD